MRWLMILMAACSLFAQKNEGPDPEDNTGFFRGPGPDPFGYTYDDTVPFSFIDISTTGTPVVLGDDTVSGALVMSQNFPFYGTSYGIVEMSSNGFLNFTVGQSSDLSNSCPLPDGTNSGAQIFGLHDDLDMGNNAGQSGYIEYFSTCPRAASQANGGSLGCTVIMWDNCEHFSTSTAWDWEIILFHNSGEIVVQVDAGNPETGSGSTTGIQNPGGTISLTYACNLAGSIPDGTAVSFIDTNYVGIDVPALSTKSLVIMIGALMSLGLLVAIRRRTA